MFALLALVIFTQGQPNEPDLDRLVLAFDDDRPAERELALNRLKTYLLSKGSEAPAILQRIRISLSAEARERMNELRKFIDGIESCRKRLQVFDLLDLPDSRGKTFIVYNPGSYLSTADRFTFAYRFGWLISDTKEGPKFLDNELQPRIAHFQGRLPEIWDKFRSSHPPNRPLPGRTMAVDFEQFCRRLLDAEEHLDPVGELEGSSLVNSTALAYWAFQRGLPLLAVELEASACAVWKRNHPDTPAQNIVDPLKEELAELWRSHAIWNPQIPRTRPDLLRLWKQAAVISPRPKEAQRMVALYELMLREDADWKEPNSEVFAALPRAAQAKCWLYGLRDLRAIEGFPEDPAFDLNAPQNPGRVGAAVALYRLGWDAVPLLLEHLDDPRPTQIVDFTGDDPRGSFELLSVGHCCRILFEEITGLPLFKPWKTRRFLLLEGSLPETREKARKWWDETRGAGEEAFYLRWIRSEDRGGLAAAHLLRIDSGKYLPVVLDHFHRVNSWTKRRLLQVLRGYLGMSHEAMIEGLLLSEDSDLQVEAARTLWRQFRSEKGVRHLLPLIQSKRLEGKALLDAVGLLTEVDKDWAVDACCAMIGSEDVQIREAGLTGASSLPCKKSAEAIVTLLNSQVGLGSLVLDDHRERDAAAEGLLSMMQLTKTFSFGGPIDQRDAKIAEIKAWWNKNQDSMDWTKLRSRRREELRLFRETP